MKTTVDKAKLIEIVTENRNNHRGLFEEAVEGYKVRAQQELNKHIERLLDGDPVSISIHMAPPQDHTDDYDRAIRMIELHNGEDITLDEEDSAQFLMDDWGWSNAFAGAYTASTGKQVIKRYS